MIALIFADVIRGYRVWLGLAAVSAAVAAAFTYVACTLTSAVANPGDLGALIAATSVAVVFFTVVAGIVVIGSTSNLVVTVQRRQIALWQLIGFTPRAVYWTFSAQILVTATVGSALGALIGTWIFTPVFRYVLSVWADPETAQVSIQPWAAIVAAACTILFVGLSGLSGARRASRTSPVQILREPEAPGGIVQWIRVGLAVVLCGVTVGIAVTRSGESLSSVATNAPFFAPLLLVACVIAAPVLYPAVISLWTRAIPATASSSWYLARNAAQYRVGLTTSAISPLMLAMGLVAGVYSAGNTLATAAGADAAQYGLDPREILLMFGGPLLISLVASASAVYITNGDRRRERALLDSAGATPGTHVATAFWESVIYVVTAMILAAVAVITATVLVALLAGAPGVSVDLIPIAVLAGVGLILLGAATLIPVVAARRASPLGALAAE
ncbi:FtsX-like permease family protein [Mycetocola saprophilus]|uniref:FtsX-like permease family protein n=1 Tax=Mycetocola saprophilus TaxID=76636 RepID=UPI0004C14F0C|nr:FtsX-like permease family protein [Mycetocola saprophilus]